MLYNILSSLKSGVSNDRQPTARRHPRRMDDRCVAVILGRTFPIENWSQGGVLMSTDERLFSIGQDIDLGVKFKLHSKILDVPVRGRVVRKSPGKVAIEFEPLTRSINRLFQQVIDDCVAGDFANSQA